MRLVQNMTPRLATTRTNRRARTHMHDPAAGPPRRPHPTRRERAAMTYRLVIPSSSRMSNSDKDLRVPSNGFLTAAGSRWECRAAPATSVLEAPARGRRPARAGDEQRSGSVLPRRHTPARAVAAPDARAYLRIGELSRELETSRPLNGKGHELPNCGKFKKDALHAAGLSTSVAHRCELS